MSVGFRVETFQSAEAYLESVPRLQSVAIDHDNTDSPHVHLLVRGRDATGRVLRIRPGYLKRRIRRRSQDLATQALGFRSERQRRRSGRRSFTLEILESRGLAEKIWTPMWRLSPQLGLSFVGPGQGQGLRFGERTRTGAVDM
jgi:hypothetical protein